MEINKLLTMEILYGKDVLYKNKKKLSITPLSFYDYNDTTRSDMMYYKITLLGKLRDENSKEDTLEYIQISSKSSMTNDAAYLELITKYPDLCNKIQSFNIGQYYNVLADAAYDHVFIFKVEDTLIKVEDTLVNKINNNNDNYHKLKNVPYNNKLAQHFFTNTASVYTLLCRKFNINKSEFIINLFSGASFSNDNQYLYLTLLSETTIISENDFVKIIEEQLGFLLEKYDIYIIDKNYICEKSMLESSYVLRFEYCRPIITPIIDEISDWLNIIKKD